jgi:serine/threonine protein kinase
MLDDKKKKIVNIEVKSKEINKKNISLKDFEYDIERPIGKGGFCTVYKAIFKDNKKIYALKVIDKSILKNDDDIKNIINEIKIMNELDSSNLLKLVTNFEDENNIYIILPLCKNGQLYDLLHKSNKKVKNIFIKKYLYQTIQAIKELHKKKIIHRDIKPENILIDNKDNALLSDFGIATHCKEGEKRNTYCGTDEYLAPEVIRGQPYDEKIDIWAIGILIYECISPLGKTPFNKIDFLKRTDDNKEYIIKNEKDLKINYDKNFDPLAKNLIEKILKINPKERLSINNILNHIFFNNINVNLRNDVFDNENEDIKNEKIINELKKIKETISKETYDKMLNSMIEENKKIKNELEEKKKQIIKLNEEKGTLLNRNQILNQTLNEYKINLNEKSKVAERLTEKRINQLSEGETTLSINLNNNLNIKNNSFNSLLISSSENIMIKSNKVQNKNKSRFYEIKDIDNFILSNEENSNEKSSSNKNNQDIDINKFANDLKSARKIFGDTIVKIDDNLNDMKHYLKKTDNEFKDKFLNKIKDFNNIIYELKDKIANSIESTMEKVNKEMEGLKGKNEKLLKDKIDENEKIIKDHELVCKPKIDELSLEVEKWKSKSESISSQIVIKDNTINNLQETIKRKNEDIAKQNKLIKNYESTYH